MCVAEKKRQTFTWQRRRKAEKIKNEVQKVTVRTTQKIFFSESVQNFGPSRIFQLFVVFTSEFGALLSEKKGKRVEKSAILASVGLKK
jgi:uncharacterized membrane protein